MLARRRRGFAPRTGKAAMGRINFEYRKETLIAALAVAGIALHLILRFAFGADEPVHRAPLYATLLLGGVPLVFELAVKFARREFGSDLLAGISIVTAVLLEEYLAGALVVLMLSGGAALEEYAARSASSVLKALANRMPNFAHRRTDGRIQDVDLDDIRVGDHLVVHPHEICPVDGTVIEGHGIMDESYLTGEPFEIRKTPGSSVLSGAVNGEAALTIEATKLPIDSRYAKIIEVMKAAEENRPRMRRLADQLGAYYTPVAVALALAAWAWSGEAVRFLAVLVVATPCPLLIAIPVSIIGAISLSAKRGIIVRDAGVLEQISQCQTIIFDKTGTLTYGEPRLTEQHVAEGHDRAEILRLVASIEQYSKHPLAQAILDAAGQENLALSEAAELSEPPGRGVRGRVAGRAVRITSRKKLLEEQPGLAGNLPEIASGLECAVLVDNQYAAFYRFHDAPRVESRSFIGHLRPKHLFKKVMLVSGDRESEVRYLADQVGIREVYASQSPEDKVAIVRRETEKAKTLFLGDGINDAPALMTATVGIAFGQNSDITTGAAHAVILDTSLERVDEFFHISERMRRIALQSAVGGMALSVGGMLFAAAGYLPPVAGAIFQEIIDVFAILNALRAAFPPARLTDYD
jgi:heavy metal translocating P-type ATPase